MGANGSFFRFHRWVEKSSIWEEPMWGQAQKCSLIWPHPPSKWQPPVKGFISCKVQTIGRLGGTARKKEMYSKDPATQWRFKISLDGTWRSTSPLCSLRSSLINVDPAGREVKGFRLYGRNRRLIILRNRVGTSRGGPNRRTVLSSVSFC